jgi:Tfp pilus assembly protein FimV
MQGKYKLLISFVVGFFLATGIGIYKQNKVAGKANVQVAKANSIISDLQISQMELNDLRMQVSRERQEFRQASQSFQNRISELQNELSNRENSSTECPQPKKPDFVLPSNLQIAIGNSVYSCKSR